MVQKISLSVPMFVVVYSIGLLLCMSKVRPLAKVASSQEHTIPSAKMLTKHYEDRAGYTIEPQEQTAISNAGSSPVYGEITSEGTLMLIKELNINKDDVFYDLGCGVGKLVLQIFLDAGVKKSVGIELAPTRVAYAKKVKEKLKNEGNLDAGRIIEFHQQDLLDADVHDATVIYIASTCFSDDFMTKVVNKLSKLKPGLRLVTLTRLPILGKFRLAKTVTLPMSWSSTTTAYVYILE
jgi:SAM-dependent methyltransferase